MVPCSSIFTIAIAETRPNDPPPGDVGMKIAAPFLTEATWGIHGKCPSLDKNLGINGYI
jgi:hypothetical protein